MDWLTREEIDEVIGGLSADDLIEATSAGVRDAKIAGVAFNRSAARNGKGEDATQRVKAGDFVYLATAIGGVINVDAPLSADTQDSQGSAVTGG